MAVTCLKGFFLFSFFLLLPSQLGLHFWPSWSHVNGIRVDYLSPTIYLTDLIIGLFFITSNIRFRIPLLLIIFVVFNVAVSVSPLVAIHKWFRLLEYFWLFRYLTSKITYSLFTIYYSLSIAVIWSSVLAWLQLIIQSSLGGFWYWLGERTFSISTPLIAKFQFFNIGQTLRAYSTFSHPNALAGFLLLSLPLLWYLKPAAIKEKGGINIIHRLVFFLSFVFAAITIPITFSRSAIFLEVAIFGTLLLFTMKSYYSKFLLIAFSSLLILVILVLGNPASLSDRVLLLSKAQDIIKNYPLQGIGYSGFVVYQDYSLNSPTIGLNFQPVHNIFLLLISELGFPASIYFFYKFTKILFKPPTYNLLLKSAFLVIIITGMTDHYWLTSHQNQLLLVIFIVLVNIKLNNVKINVEMVK